MGRNKVEEAHLFPLSTDCMFCIICMTQGIKESPTAGAEPGTKSIPLFLV
jgi:hypothetical protein